MTGNDVLNSAQIFESGIEDWRQLAGPIRARFLTGDFTRGLSFINRLAEAAESADHHPDITFTNTYVMITLSSHDVGGVTDRDIALARKISTIAAEARLTSDTANLVQAEFALDTASGDSVSAFYAALIGGQHSDTHAGGGLVDPTGQVNALWWQEPRDHSAFPLTESEVEQRWHLDVWVSHDEAERRIDAALAAGGQLVSDKAAPSYWVLEDPDGNRSCICAPMVH